MHTAQVEEGRNPRLRGVPLGKRSTSWPPVRNMQTSMSSNYVKWET